MADLAVLDQVFHSGMMSLVNTGRAPHYTDVARELGLPMEEGSQIFHDLMDAGIPTWLHPGTNHIASFPRSTT